MTWTLLCFLLVSGWSSHALVINNYEYYAKNVCSGQRSGRVAHPSNCSLYYKCTNERATLISCSNDYWFNSKLKKCVDQELFSEEEATKCGKLPKNSFVKIRRCIIDPIVDVQWKHDNFEEKSVSALPKEILMQIPVGSQMKTLKLMKKANATKNLKTWSVYSDLNSESSVSVAIQDTNGIKNVVYDGSFVDNQKKYYIRSDEGRRSSPLEASKTRPLIINGSSYLLVEENKLASQYDTLRAAQSTSANVTSLMTNLEKLVNAQLQSGATKRKFGLELFIVLDYSIFYKWYSQSKETNDLARTADAIYNIRYFYTHVVNGINDRYASIQEDDMSFYVKLVGYYIAQTPSDSQFTEKPNIKLSSYATEAYNALDEFEKWIANNAMNLPRFDSAALFTDYTMLAYNSFHNDTYQITGLANIGATCTLKGVSINKNFGQYATIETASHEIGHNLGAWHDGSDNTCGASDQFIMSPAPGSLTNQTFNNPFTFSQCSINYFRNYIAKLDQGNNNCLLNEAFDVEPTDQAGFLQQYPGQKYSVDKQCQLLYGQNAFYCAGGGERDASICRELKCYDPSQGKCVSRVEQRALDGTTCSNKFWCIRGVCVADNRASAAPASCIYGDYKDVFNYQSGSISCSYMTSNLPWMCYDNYYSALCCTSCAKIRNKKFPGCEYGDRDNTCASISSRQCYDSNKQSQCCATCLKRELNLPVPNCRYGDKVDWCSTMSSNGCYTSSDYCCQYCLTFKTEIQNCEFGDKIAGCSLDHCKDASLRQQCCKTCQSFTVTTTTITTTTTTQKPSSGTCPLGDRASWCSTITSDACYGSKETCCLKCSSFYNPSYPGCEYGDKASWCRLYVKGADECKISEVANLCCASCRAYITPNSEIPSCPNGDQAFYCSTIKPSECYSSKSTCCTTCAKYYDSTNQNCEYGDKADWCSSYVQGPAECQRTEVASLCCKTCKDKKKIFEVGTCVDSADWCKGMFAGFCYDPSVASTCCAACASYSKESKGECLYGDMYSWCSKEFCSMNAAECCQSCKN
ncbi:hypothetical protein HELRODRAFT_163021 [Helobdella robusta]|uniref:Chitin-binding type-2 domain-containing protein n=1 Tax=Helobdella robusta TaxID=6412 RepID=T1ETK9_HELRO|nr:hypothetical protein HELRODRAFT_163021 [Helobdella robusta]ESN99471.1 hypothetical protein HELRODRAFT_163021 [Helobdella robusta]